MNLATHFFIEQKLKKYGADLQAATRRVSQARTLREVRDFSEVHPESLIRSISGHNPEISRLEHVVQDKACAIVKKQIKELKETLNKDGPESYRSLKATFTQRDWCFLRGRFSRALIQLQAELRIIENDAAITLKNFEPAEPGTENL